MGLAASQARFLGLTARKSNIEYEGQQVNQQRTALAEEVNSLYSKLLSLDIPIAPDTTEFYETNYSFEATNTDGYDGEYVINNYYPTTEESIYNVNATRTYSKNVAEGKQYKANKVEYNATTGIFTFTDDNGNQHELSSNPANKAAIVGLINESYPDQEQLAADEELYYYTDTEGQTHYIPASQLSTDPTTQEKFSVYIQKNKEVSENLSFTAKFDFDDNGRVSNISNAIDPITNTELDFNAEVNTTRTYDTEGSDAALRDYTMNKEEYNKAVADLNAQTESLQQEDKVLELRLNQIDTEQNALQTELDAVKSILDKNIEKTFNTFS